jgi:hypothetical protein
LPEWNDSFLLENDLEGDSTQTDQDLTAGYAAADNKYLYFEIGLSDPNTNVVQFDIFLEINGVELLISQNPGDLIGYANDMNNIGIEGPTQNSIFQLGDTYQGQISLEFLGYPEKINLRRITVMAGVCCESEWIAADTWETQLDTPRIQQPDVEITEVPNEELADEDLTVEESTNYLPYLIGGGIILVIVVVWVIIKRK